MRGVVCVMLIAVFLVCGLSCVGCCLVLFSAVVCCFVFVVSWRCLIICVCELSYVVCYVLVLLFYVVACCSLCVGSWSSLLCVVGCCMLLCVVC